MLLSEAVLLPKLFPQLFVGIRPLEGSRNYINVSAKYIPLHRLNKKTYYYVLLPCIVFLARYNHINGIVKFKLFSGIT